MSVALLVITDGRRECLERTIASADEHLHGRILDRVMYDDSGDHVHRAWLRETFPDYTLIFHPTGRQGFGGAIRTAWRFLTGSNTRWIFHLEDDFTFNRDVDLTEMAYVLDEHPHLVQLALRRQPWNADERAAGGIVEQHPADYTDCSDEAGHAWLEHRRFFTTNPSLYRRSLVLKHVWPRGTDSEGMFTHHLLQSPKVRFGFWGARDSGEWVEHIGTERVGVGY